MKDDPQQTRLEADPSDKSITQSTPSMNICAQCANIGITHTHDHYCNQCDICRQFINSQISILNDNNSISTSDHDQSITSLWGRVRKKRIAWIMALGLIIIGITALIIFITNYNNVSEGLIYVNMPLEIELEIVARALIAGGDKGTFDADTVVSFIIDPMSNIPLLSDDELYELIAFLEELQSATIEVGMKCIERGELASLELAMARGGFIRTENDIRYIEDDIIEKLGLDDLTVYELTDPELNAELRDKVELCRRWGGSTVLKDQDGFDFLKKP